MPDATPRTPPTATLPPLRDGRPAPDDLVARREGVAAVPVAPVPEGITVETADVAGVPCVICSHAAPIVDVVYFHGGGFRLGTAAGWTGFGGTLASLLCARVTVVDYRLAPEHPYPAALHDAVAVRDAVLTASDRPLFVGGDSAGGGLALSLVLLADDRARERTAGVFVFSPWADLTVSNPSYASNAESDQLFSHASGSDAAELYLQGHDPHDPIASAVFGDFTGAPPALIFASAHETLLDDACALARALATAGVDTTLHTVPNMPHVWPFLQPDHAESARALDEVVRFAAWAVEDGG